jgi:type IV pilus assembly protein PilW
MNQDKQTSQKQRGLTLIEIMIALVISSFLMLGAMTLFISNKRIFNEMESMGRLQENARFAINLLISDLRMAGYLGCSDDPTLVTNTLTGAGTAGNLFNFDNPIEGSDNGGAWSPSASGDPVSTYAVGGTTSDAITIRFADPIANDASLSANMANGAVGTDIPLACTGADCSNFFDVGEPLAISDCASTDIFDLTAVTSNDISHGSAALSKGYNDTSQISRYVTNRYFIANGTNGPALFRRTFAQDKGDVDIDTNTTEFLAQDQELIEGVEAMHIMYGVDSDADQIANSHVVASGVVGAGGWDNVVSVKIAILVRTINADINNETDTRTYNLLGTIVNPVDDQRRRRVFGTTVEIRNRT